VTGAGKGLGRAVAKAFFQNGGFVAALSRNPADLASLESELQPEKGRFLSMAGDVASPEDSARFGQEVRRLFKRVDCLVNNAGVLAPRGRIHEISIPDWDEAMRINVRGPFLMIKEFLPAMLRQKSGSIINVSSGAGKRGSPQWGAYAVSKYALEGITQVTAAEVCPLGIRVNSVNPGGMRTRMRAAAYPDENPAELPTPEEVSRLFLWLASDDSRDVCGQSIDYRQWAKTLAG